MQFIVAFPNSSISFHFLGGELNSRFLTLINILNCVNHVELKKNLSFGLVATVLGQLPAIAGSMPMVVMVVLLLLFSGGQFCRTGTSRRGRAGRRSTLGVVLQLVRLAQHVLFRVFGDALGRDALAPFAHVGSQWTLLLLLAERARVLDGFALGLSLSSNRRRRLVPLILLLLKSRTILWRTVQRVLQRPIRELLVIPVQRVPERSILDAIAHVVHIHPEGERRGGGYRDKRGEANVELERAFARVGTLWDFFTVLNEVSCYSKFLPCTRVEYNSVVSLRSVLRV